MSEKKTSTARLYGPEECLSLRDTLVREWIVPRVQTAFERCPAVQSAVLAVAQYWDDEAHDAVHAHLLYSIHPNPDFDAYVATALRDDDEPEDPEAFAWDFLLEGPGSGLDYWELMRIGSHWPANQDAVPAFAAFCAEGANQNQHPADCYVPYAVLRRGHPGVHVEIVGTMLRPWLDGLAPEWGMPAES